MKSTLHTIFASLAAAAVTLIAAVCASCGAGGNSANSSDETAATAPSPDTLALVEGLRLFETGRYDLARESLAVSARSESSYIRVESFLYLNALEMELGNYRQARAYLDRYHAETVLLLRRAADSQSRSERQTARLVGRYEALVGWMSLALAAMLGVAMFFVRRHGAARSPREGTSRSADVSELGPDGAHESAGPSPEERAEWLTEAEAFRRTEMWAEIEQLAAGRPGRDARVLTIVRQEAMEAALSAAFPAFTAHLRAVCPSLTAGDVKLCCLSLAGLAAFGRAVCFGSTETNTIKQRKHTIKKKLSADARSRALFEFVFSAK